MMQMIQSHKISCFIGMYTSLFLFRPTSFGNLNALSGGVHKLVVEAGDILVVPARWPHIVATKGDSIAFASNFLAVTHFPLIVDTHLNASQQEIDNEEVFPGIIRIYAVLQFKIRQLQRELIKRGRWSPLFASEQLTLFKEQVSNDLQEIQMVRNFCYRDTETAK